MTTPHTSTMPYIPREFEPDWAIAPGAMIQETLEDLRFTQADVAARASISAKHLNQVIKAHVPLSPEVAVALERVLGVPADHWLALEATWQAHKARENSAVSFAGLASWLRRFPTEVLRERKIVDSQASVSARADALLRFFQVADTTAFDKVWLGDAATLTLDRLCGRRAEPVRPSAGQGNSGWRMVVSRRVTERTVTGSGLGGHVRQGGGDSGVAR